MICTNHLREEMVMTKNIFRFTAPLVGLMVLALGWSGGAGAAESFKLKMQTAVPGGSSY